MCWADSLTLPLLGSIPLLTHRLHRQTAQFSAWLGYIQCNRGLLQKLPFKIALGYLFLLLSAPFTHGQLLSFQSFRACKRKEENPKYENRLVMKVTLDSYAVITVPETKICNLWSDNRIECLKPILAWKTKTYEFLIAHNYSKMSIYFPKVIKRKTSMV